ncbi:methyltransferase domain-containing protein [Thiocapsa rosea]|uniref:Methyltransferase family protein n=1 Tax=Thiocapsa rosea TaxID=69360 RepID=A0A495VFT8_9GAMM|nr:methyltransferase domain-containing protein [Thiocapsa rosea]RKT47443.1 methyltransferase family protein [Thiocapsa rosea]
MQVIEPNVKITAADHIFTSGIRVLQTHVIQHIDRLRKPHRQPYSQNFKDKMRSLGVDMGKIGWRGAMTFLPYRAEYLIGQIETRPPKRMLEVGAGSSTLLFAALAHRYGFEIVSLENHKASVQYVRHLLDGTPFSDRVTLQICNFRRREYDNGDSYWWYAADLSSQGDPFDLVFVDGPISTIVGRNGALPEVIPFLKDGARVYVDDINRPSEQRVLREWKDHFPRLIIATECRGIAKITFPRNSASAESSP